MRRVAALALISGVVWPSAAVLAADPGACYPGRDWDQITCGGEVSVSIPGNGGGSSSGSAAPQPVNSGGAAPVDTQTGLFEGIGEGFNTGGCTGGSPAAGPDWLPPIANPFDPSAPCPPANGRSDAPPETPSQIAARHWEDVPLPTPQPHIAPGRAITGKLAYLETRGRLQHSYTQDTPLGRLEIDARGTYTVDWGDGETSGPFTAEGAPWPDGQITHDYVNVGAYDIVVTERWTATWRMGAESGSLQELRTVGRIDDFPVEQLQAVRER